MFNKFLSVLVLIGLIATSNSSISAQTQSAESKNSQQSPILKKDFFNSADRPKELLDKDSFTKVKKGSITPKAMRDAEKPQHKKNFAGLNTTTAIIIGVVLVTTIVIVFAAKSGDDDRNGPIFCGGVRAPCP